MIDQYKLDLVARAGGSFYSRARDAFFEIPKPLVQKGIGIDNLPEFVRNSEVLTGNDLGQLGNVEQLPESSDVDKFMEDNPEYMTPEINEKHKFAHEFLNRNEVKKAWMVLLS
jgi:hypothetical protein